mgnify:CR=1 FL=1
MKQRKEKAVANAPDLKDLLRNIKALIRSHRQMRSSGRVSSTLPHPLERAVEVVRIHKQSISITSTETGEKVAVIHGKWIPLIERLERGEFSREELTALDYSVFDEMHTPEKRSKEVVDWAKNLK